MTAKASLREKHTTETRQRIVDEAMALFIEHGFEATTVDEIATHADVSPRTFFRYFPTKEAVIFHDLEDRLSQVQTWIRERPVDESPFASLVHVLCRMIDDAVEGPPERRALIVRLVSERPSLRSYQRTTIAEHTEAQVTALLAERTGLAADDLGLRATVAAVGACFDTALRVWTEHGATGPFDEIFLAALSAVGLAFPAGTNELGRR